MYALFGMQRNFGNGTVAMVVVEDTRPFGKVGGIVIDIEDILIVVHIGAQCHTHTFIGIVSVEVEAVKRLVIDASVCVPYRRCTLIGMNIVGHAKLGSGGGHFDADVGCITWKPACLEGDVGLVLVAVFAFGTRLQAVFGVVVRNAKCVAVIKCRICLEVKSLLHRSGRSMYKTIIGRSGCKECGIKRFLGQRRDDGNFSSRGRDPKLSRSAAIV